MLHVVVDGEDRNLSHTTDYLITVETGLYLSFDYFLVSFLYKVQSCVKNLDTSLTFWGCFYNYRRSVEYFLSRDTMFVSKDYIYLKNFYEVYSTQYHYFTDYLQSLT